MCDYWPYLDIRDGVKDCDRALDDIVRTVHTLQQESEGHCPPAADALLANVAALRELLGWLLPPAVHEAIVEEQKHYGQ